MENENLHLSPKLNAMSDEVTEWREPVPLHRRRGSNVRFDGANEGRDHR